MYRSCRALALCASAAFVVFVFPYACLRAPAAQTDSSAASANSVTTAARTLYVLVDPSSDRPSAVLMTIAAAAELNRYFSGDLPNNPQGSAFGANPKRIWAIPQPSWKLSDFADQCANKDTRGQTIGAVMLSYYIGDATHFWLLWQTQTTSIEMTAQVVWCNQDPSASVPSETVAVISQLHNSDGTPWVVRRTDVSIPLISGVAVAALIYHGTHSEASNTLSVAALGSAFLSAGFNKDIPGYSQPVRYRFSTHHAGADLAHELRWLCRIPDPELTGNSAVLPPTIDAPGLQQFCAALGWPYQ